MNSPFWTIARRMLRYRAMVAWALLFAFISAAGLGAGLVGMVPVLENILGQTGSTLPELAADYNIRAQNSALLPVIPQTWIDALPADRWGAVVGIISALVVITILGASANFTHEFLSLTLTTRVIADVRRSAFRKLVYMPLGALTHGSAHDMTSRIINDTNVLNRGLQSLTSKAVAQVTKGIAAIIVAFIINWKLSLVTVLLGPVLFIIIRKLGKRIKRASKRALKGQAQLLEVANEVTRGFRVVKVYTAERAEIGRFTRTNKQVLREMLRLRTATALASPLVETISIIVLGVLAIIAARAIINQSLSASEFFLTLGSLAIAGSTLKPMSGIIQRIQTADAAAARLNELLDAEPEAVRVPGMPRLARHAETIVYDKVGFTYTGQDQPAITGVSLSIKSGETVAFVGPNGCGKTTLLSLIPRLFEPTEGRILIDGTDIASVSLRSLRGQIGAVTQETILFRGTIADNISYGTPGASREQIEEAARKAHAHEFIVKQPDGYDTRVGDQGLTLSGGQRQRIAIARALLRDPAILIMDEATSMIDSESESQIAEAVAEFSHTRTCLIVAHRLATVVNADRIVVMNAGGIEDVGTHEELLERCDLYQHLTKHQLSAPA